MNGTPMKLVAATMLLAVATSPAAAQPAADDRVRDVASLPEAARAAWSDLVTEWRSGLEAEGIVGASLGLVHGGALVSHETHGLADLATGRAVDEETIYHWASITKTFTAISIMQLRDRGLISLDDPIVDYVPELRGVHNPFGPMEEITIRHLMSHSAGFRGSTWPWGGSEPWHPHEPTEWSQLVAMVPYTEIRFEPGSRYSYSNPGIIFLGRVIEAVTGDVFEAYVDKNIFRPLGMRRAYFDVTPWHLLEPIGDGPLGHGSMGLSFFLHDKGGERVVGHTGTQRAFYSFFYVDPTAGTGVLGAFNTGPGDEAGPDTNRLRIETSARVVDELFVALRDER